MYERQLENIWHRLKDLNAPEPRHAITTRTAFNDVCAAFIQAEIGSDVCEARKGAWGGIEDVEPINDVKTYRAEWNIWAYYYGEQDPFPGIDPALQSNNRVTESRADKHYDPNYAVKDAELQDTGSTVQGDTGVAFGRGVRHGKRGILAIAHRAREAEKFLLNSYRKAAERKARKENLMKVEQEAKEEENQEQDRMRSYGRNAHGCREPVDDYHRKEDGYKQRAGGGSRRDEEFERRADGHGGKEKDEGVAARRKGNKAEEMKKSSESFKSHYRKRSMSPARGGGGGDWRGDASSVSDTRDYRDRDYNNAGREKRGRGEGGRSTCGAGRALESRERGRQHDVGGSVHGERGEGGRRRRQDRREFEADRRLDRTSQCIQDEGDQSFPGEVSAESRYRDENVEHSAQGGDGGRDRGFGVMMDATASYKELRRYR